MRINNPLISLAALALFTAPAIAWEHDFTRGLDLYSATDNGVTIRLICDPNRVYGGTESMVLISVGGDTDLNTTATLAFPGRETISAPLVHSRLAKRDMPDTQWRPLLDGLRNTSRLELTIGDNTRNVALGDPPAFTCL